MNICNVYCQYARDKCANNYIVLINTQYIMFCYYILFEILFIVLFIWPDIKYFFSLNAREQLTLI